MRFDPRIAAFVLFAIPMLTPNAARADDVPATAGAFAAFCTPLKDACRSKIILVQVTADATTMTNNSSAKSCDVPDGIEAEPADKAIVVWLSAHPETASMTTADGISAAIKGLWQCQAKIATGITSWGVPDNAQAFVAFCKAAKNYVKCANQITQASVNASAQQTFNDKSAHCSAPDGVTPKDATAKVLAWLKKHKEANGLSTEDATASAVDHLWPCH
jgi:hypothetical protein